MFEQSLQTEEYKDRQAAEGRGPDEIKARRLAAVVVASSAILSFLVVFIASPANLPILQTGIALFIAWYLYKLRPRAENLTLGLAILATVLMPLFVFTHWALFPAI